MRNRVRFYAGKTVNFIVGTDVAAASASTPRVVAPFGAIHSGAPTLVMKNMPGAGGATAASYLYRIAPKDVPSSARYRPTPSSAACSTAI